MFNNCLYFQTIAKQSLNNCLHFQTIAKKLFNNCLYFQTIAKQLLNNCLHFQTIAKQFKLLPKLFQTIDLFPLCSRRSGFENIQVSPIIHWTCSRRRCTAVFRHWSVLLRLVEPEYLSKVRGGGFLNPGSTQVRTLGLDQRGGGRISTSRTWVQPRFNPGSTQVQPRFNPNPRSTQVQPRFSDPGSNPGSTQVQPRFNPGSTQVQTQVQCSLNARSKQVV